MRDLCPLWAETREPCCSVLSVTFSHKSLPVPQPPFMCVSYPPYLCSSCPVYRSWVALLSSVLSGEKSCLHPFLPNPPGGLQNDTVSKCRDYHVSLWHNPILGSLAVWLIIDTTHLRFDMPLQTWEPLLHLKRCQTCFKICLRLLNFRDTQKEEQENAVEVEYCPLWFCPGQSLWMERETVVTKVEL